MDKATSISMKQIEIVFSENKMRENCKAQIIRIKKTESTKSKSE